MCNKKTFSVGTIDFNYELLGSESSPSIVLIAGYTGDLNLWRGIAQELARDFRVLIFDPQGSGETVDDGSPLTVTEMASNIYKLWCGLGLTCPSVVGFAFGGIVAQALASMYPLKITHLGLVCCVREFDSVAAAYFEELCQLRESGTASDFKRFAALLYDTGFGSNFKKTISQEMFVGQFAGDLEGAQEPADMRRQLEALKAWRHIVPVDVNRNNVVFVVGADEDQYAKVDQVNELAECYQVEAQFVSGCGHALLLENPAAVTKIIRKSFLSG